MATIAPQPTLWEHIPGNRVQIEDPAYLREQLLTYIGNKRSLLSLISDAIASIKRRLDRPTLSMLDAFAGSGVVSRLFKQHAHFLISNDFEPYAAVVGRCYLANRSKLDMAALHDSHTFLLERAKQKQIDDGFIRRLYAPKNENHIQRGERVFYTIDNARRIDTFRTLISQLPAAHQDFFLGPLLSEASVHANTSGVFKGFYKDAHTGVGQFGGSARNALPRILGPIELPFPLFSQYDQEVRVYQKDANLLVRELPDLDVAYLDPPYNQHPYGSNYFMLNLIVSYQEPNHISRVSGIPTDWQRSNYNKRTAATQSLEGMIASTKATFILISYNDEGFIHRREFDAILSRYGKYEVFEERYNAFRGSRNLRGRATHVTEQLFLLERQ